MIPRIIPLNLPARARKEIAGNPVTSRPESVVANCFPGLEIDHRNLDRRFFPGLTVEFVTGSQVGSNGLGAKIVGVNPDPDVPKDPAFARKFEKIQKALADGRQLFLLSLKQGRTEILLRNQKAPQDPLDGLVVWRLVRSLQPGMVTVTLGERMTGGKKDKTYASLRAHRRIYQKENMIIPETYPVGEMNQSLCSPWQHDFRDCACNYWASNHPDIVLGNDSEQLPQQPPGVGSAEPATRNLIWLRSEQASPVAARETKEQCRPFEMDHYEINRRWQELPVVLEGYAMRTVYIPEETANAEPFANEKELVDKLHGLAAMEHALALEYLYARYSVIEGNSLKPKLRPHAEYVAHELLMIASSEMMHLRWANQLLWELRHNRPGSGTKPTPEPELRIATSVPHGEKSPREVKMRSLTKAIDDFIAAEKYSATLDGQYARVFATLQYDYPPSLAELASRIIADGVSHYVRFREIKTILLSHATSGKAPGEALRVPFVREIEPVPKGKRSKKIQKDLKTMQGFYREIFSNLKYAYHSGDPEHRESIADARKAMLRLDDAAVKFSAKYPKVGIPLDEIGRNVAGSYPK